MTADINADNIGRTARLRHKAGRILVGAMALWVALVGISALGATAAHASTTSHYETLAEPSLNVRDYMSTSYPVIGSLPYHTTVTVLCQATGTSVNGSDIWDEISGHFADGLTWGWVSDYYVSTPNVGTYSPGLGVCPIIVVPYVGPNPTS